MNTAPRASQRAARSNRGTGKGLQFILAALSMETDDCIEWPFYRMKNGYGQVGLHDGMALAHRHTCVLAHGEPPFPGAQSAHSCHNRACINKRHVRWASQAENEQDKLDNGTWDTRKAGAKITADTARRIRADRAELGLTYKALAERHGTTPANAAQIVRGKSWREPEAQP